MATPAERSARQRILDVTLSLMAQRGVAGTSMRDLASAAGLNVASLYHYFPSKHDLLMAVLAERGVISELAAPPRPTAAADTAAGLADLLDEILQSMLAVEDFIRLMLGEAMRGDETVQAVGSELLAATQSSLERWLEATQPELVRHAGAQAPARVLRAVLVGLFFEHVAGVLEDDGDTAKAFHERATEVAATLRSPRSDRAR